MNCIQGTKKPRKNVGKKEKEEKWTEKREHTLQKTITLIFSFHFNVI